MSALFCNHSNQAHGKASIVFLHHLFASHVEYDNVVPYLRDYHLMRVDLRLLPQTPGGPPFEVETITEDLAALIREHARDGRAHLVGISFGGFLALESAKQFPDLTLSVFATGAVPLEGWRRTLAEQSFILYFEYGLVSFLRLCPEWLYSYICDWLGAESHTNFHAETSKNFSLPLLKQSYATILRVTADDLAMISTRTLLVAASVLDNVEGTKKMGRLLQTSNPKSRAAVVPGLVHAWNLRFPELFANTIIAWTEDTDLPEGLEKLL